MLAEIILVLLCIFIFWTHHQITNRHIFELIKNFDIIGPDYPFIGHLYMVIGLSADEQVRKICDLTAKCERTTRIWFLNKLVIALNSPQDIQTVLCSPHCLEKGSPYKALGTASGLIASHPNEWKPHRRMLNPPFNLTTVKSFIPRINELSRELVKDIEPYCSKKSDISLLDKIGIRIMEISLNNVLEHGFDTETVKNSYFLVNETMDAMGERVVNYYTNTVYVFFERLLNVVTYDEKIIARLLSMLDVAFLAGKQKHMPDIEAEAKAISTEEQLRTTSDVFLKRIYRMAYHDCMTQACVKETVTLLVAAATDTTTRSIGNILLCLGMHPEIQEKLHDQLMETMKGVEEIDFDTIVQFEYLDRVIKESLRYLTLVPVIIRRANKNIQLEHGVIPAGTDVMISIDNIHKKESVWGPNYNKFDPDHFLPENCAKRNPCSFIAFSYGQRNCIGYRYAQLVLKITVANLVKNYKFSTDLTAKDLKYGFGLTGKLLNEYDVKVTKRL